MLHREVLTTLRSNCFEGNLNNLSFNNVAYFTNQEGFATHLPYSEKAKKNDQ